MPRASFARGFFIYNRGVDNNFRDISGIAGVAQPKTQDQREMAQAKVRLWGERADGSPVSSGNFTHPDTNIAAMHLDPGMKVADFGAGSGAYALGAARVVGRTGRVYAVDVQKDLLTRIRNTALKEGIDWLDIIWGDFENPGGTKIRDKSLDVVVMSNVLFQLDRPAGAFAEARRVLKPTGRLVIIDWMDSFAGLGPEPKRVVTKEKALGFAIDAGFEFAREFAAGAHHYGIILKLSAPK